jgi:hypothetical protein
MSGRGTVIVLGLAGLAVAALLGLTGYFVARETIALPATSVPAGEDLAPPARSATTAPIDTTPPTTRERTETDEDEGGRGRGRGRGGDDSSGSSADDDRSGSSGSGRGRGRGRGGDD